MKIRSIIKPLSNKTGREYLDISSEAPTAIINMIQKSVQIINEKVYAFTKIFLFLKPHLKTLRIDIFALSLKVTILLMK